MVLANQVWNFRSEMKLSVPWCQFYDLFLVTWDLHLATDLMRQGPHKRLITIDQESRQSFSSVMGLVQAHGCPEHKQFSFGKVVVFPHLSRVPELSISEVGWLP